MKKIFLFLPILGLFGQYAHADDHNPFFGDHRHQVALGIGQGVNSGLLIPPPIQFVPFSEIHLQYSVPNTFFYFPGRLSLNVTQTIGWGERYGWDWERINIPIFYLTQDVALFHGQRWYLGPGGGGGFQAKENYRIGSKLIFTFKVFFGYRFTESFGMEVYIKHFSNGNTAPENNSYGFYGLSATYNF